jgi:hypothetical protein
MDDKDEDIQIAGVFTCRKCGNRNWRDQYDGHSQLVIALLVSKNECEMRCDWCNKRRMHDGELIESGCLYSFEEEILPAPDGVLKVIGDELV